MRSNPGFIAPVLVITLLTLLGACSSAPPRPVAVTASVPADLPDPASGAAGSRQKPSAAAVAGPSATQAPATTPNAGPAATAGPTPAQQVYLEGRKALDADNLDAAIRLFNRAIGLDSTLIDAWSGLGVALNLAGRQAEALKIFRQAVAIAPSDATAQANLGLALQGDGRSAEAREALARARRLAPDDARILAAQESLPDDAASTDGPKNDAANADAATADAATAATATPVAAAAPVESASPAASASTAPPRPTVAPRTRSAPPLPPANTIAPKPEAAAAKPASTSPKPAAAAPTPAATAPTPAAAAPKPVAPPASAKRVPGLVVSDDRSDRSNANAVVQLLARGGFSGQRVGAAPMEGPQITTEIHYRKGFDAQVRALQAALPVKTYAAELDALPAGVNVRLLVGRQLGEAASR